MLRRTFNQLNVEALSYQWIATMKPQLVCNGYPSDIAFSNIYSAIIHFYLKTNSASIC